jgi:hypothetical protein
VEVVDQFFHSYLSVENAHLCFFPVSALQL